MKNKARHAIAVNLIESQQPADPIRSRLALYERFAVIPASPELTGSALNLHLSQAVSY